MILDVCSTGTEILRISLLQRTVNIETMLTHNVILVFKIGANKFVLNQIGTKE